MLNQFVVCKCRIKEDNIEINNNILIKCCPPFFIKNDKTNLLERNKKMSRPYIDTIVTTTTAGSTDLPGGFQLVSITNTSAANFCTISFDGPIGSTDNPEGVIPAEGKEDFSIINRPFPVKVLYHQSDTANVSLTIVGYIA